MLTLALRLLAFVFVTSVAIGAVIDGTRHHLLALAVIGLLVWAFAVLAILQAGRTANSSLPPRRRWPDI